MKPSFLSLFIFLLGITWATWLKAGNDLPPATSNIETIPAGAWVLAMDNTHQGTSGIMNIKAYGLAAELLWQDIPLKWAIKAGKGKDSMDMRRTLTQQIIPSYQAPPSLPGVNFESGGSAYSPALTYSGTGSVRGDAGKYVGTRSYRLTRNNSITMANVPIDQYIDVVMSVSFAWTGPDAGENLYLDVSYDGGTTWPSEYTIQMVTGNGNSGNINTTNTNTVSPNAYSINIPEWATQVRVRFRVPDVASMTTSEFFYVDNVIFTGTYVRNFYSGPMIIMPQDTALARTIIEAYNAPLSATEKVNLYVMTGSKDVDIRHTISHKPYIAIYNDGGNAAIHESVLTAAGITSSKYDILGTGYVIDSSSCYTLASTPHWAIQQDEYSGTDSLRLNNLQEFLLSGGNFLAQCEGIDAIENYPPQRYQSTNGFESTNTAVTTLVYGNPDMPFMQAHGAFTPASGSVTNYRPTPGSSDWSSVHYMGYYFNKTVGGVNSDIAIASATKYAHEDSIGGNIFYLGGHEYSGSGIGDVNGRRLYLNSVFVPARRLISTGVITPSHTVCQYDTIRLNFTPPSTGYTFVWSGPNGFTSTEQSPYIANAQFVHSGTYTVTITTAEGCNYTYHTTITVPAKPEITATTTTGAICSGDAAVITFTPSNTVASAAWYYKDSTRAGCYPASTFVGYDVEQMVQPANTTSFAVIGTTSSGCMDTSCITIVVDHAPAISSPYPTATPLCYSKGVSATITPGSGGTNCIEEYEWRMDGGVWQSYTSGDTVGLGASDSVEIRAVRNCVEGCQEKVVLSTWDVADPLINSALSQLANCTNISGFIAELDAEDPSPSTGVWTKISGPGVIVNPTATSTTLTGVSTIGVETSLKWVVTDYLGCKDSSVMTISPPPVDEETLSAYSDYFCLSCPVLDGGLYYFYDNDGRLMATLSDLDDGLSLGATDFCCELTYDPNTTPGVEDVPMVAADYGVVQPYLPRIWSVNSEQEGEMDIRLYFSAEELAALMGWTNSGSSMYEFNNVNALIITAYPNNGASSIEPGSPGGISITPVFTQVGDMWEMSFRVPSSSTFYAHPYEYANAPLPVELVSLRATGLDNTIMIDWETASELNNDHFDVERSIDGVNFIKIGEVAGAGYSTITRHYSLQDDNVVKGKLYYYRLKQVDNIDNYTYSEIVSASIYTEGSKVSIGDLTPNPSISWSRVKVSSPQRTNMKLVVSNLEGRILMEKHYNLDKGNTDINIDISALTPGTYLSHFHTVEGTISRKLVVMK